MTGPVKLSDGTVIESGSFVLDFPPGITTLDVRSVVLAESYFNPLIENGHIWWTLSGCIRLSSVLKYYRPAWASLDGLPVFDMTRGSSEAETGHPPLALLVTANEYALDRLRHLKGPFDTNEIDYSPILLNHKESKTDVLSAASAPTPTPAPLSTAAVAATGTGGGGDGVTGAVGTRINAGPSQNQTNSDGSSSSAAAAAAAPPTALTAQTAQTAQIDPRRLWPQDRAALKQIIAEMITAIPSTRNGREFKFAGSYETEHQTAQTCSVRGCLYTSHQNCIWQSDKLPPDSQAVLCSWHCYDRSLQSDGVKCLYRFPKKTKGAESADSTATVTATASAGSSPSSASGASSSDIDEPSGSETEG